MRLLIITTNFPRWEGDPHSPWLIHLLGLLRAEGAEIDVLAPAYAGLGDQQIYGMAVHRFRYAPSPWETLTHEAGAPAKIRQNPLYLLLLPLYLLAGMWAAWRLARRHEFDVIHVHWPVPQGLFGWVARQASRRKFGRSPRLVATFYGADLVLAERFSFVKPFLAWFVGQCDDLAAISTYTRRTLTGLTGSVLERQPRTIPYGIELPPADADWPTEPGKLLFVGRLIPRKGLSVLVRAMSHVPAGDLTIIGGGPEREPVQALVDELGLGDRIRFGGRVSDEELEQRYQSCDIFVLPAIIDATGDTEMLGMVLLEAMRYRRPVIASDVGGIPDIVRDGENGLLVPQQDPAALAAAINRLLTDRDLSRRLGEAGYTYARDHFGWETILAQTKGMYGSVEIAGD
jgi:glycosyltransferase involved in cell wall biosynthesis